MSSTVSPLFLVVASLATGGIALAIQQVRIRDLKSLIERLRQECDELRLSLLQLTRPTADGAPQTDSNLDWQSEIGVRPNPYEVAQTKQAPFSTTLASLLFVGVVFLQFAYLQVADEQRTAAVNAQEATSSTLRAREQDYDKLQSRTGQLERDNQVFRDRIQQLENEERPRPLPRVPSKDADGDLLRKNQELRERIDQLERRLGREQSQIERSFGAGDVRVTLRWDNGADVDLVVVDPAGERIYYQNPFARSGGRLDRDETNGFGPESIYWPPRSAPSGTYRVLASLYSGPAARYTITIQIGTNSTSYTGTVGRPGIDVPVTSFSVKP